jgi:cell division protein FtsB
MVRFGLLGSYDPLVEDLRRMEQQIEALRDMPIIRHQHDGSGVHDPLAEEIEGGLRLHASLIARLAARIEELKMWNARLQNSATYLPVTAGELAARAAPLPDAQDLEQQLAELLRVLATYRSGADTERTALVEIGAWLRANRGRWAPAIDPGTLDLLASHVILYAETLPRVDSIVAEITSGRAEAQLRDLENAHSARAAFEQTSANRARRILSFLALLLLAVIAYTTIRLVMAGRELRAANRDLEERVRQRTTELTRATERLTANEQRHWALLNALPDMFLRIRADGTVLDARRGRTLNLPVPPSEAIGNDLTAVMTEEQLADPGLETRIRSGAATRYAVRIAALGSSTVGQVAPNSAMKSRAGAGGSNISTPTIARPVPACSANFSLNSGNSSRHGTQLGPQKLRSTGRPRRSAMSNGTPSSVVPVTGGAAWPRAIGFGAGSIIARNWTRANVATAATRSPSRMSRR